MECAVEMGMKVAGVCSTIIDTRDVVVVGGRKRRLTGPSRRGEAGRRSHGFDHDDSSFARPRRPHDLYRERDRQRTVLVPLAELGITRHMLASDQLAAFDANAIRRAISPVPRAAEESPSRALVLSRAAPLPPVPPQVHDRLPSSASPQKPQVLKLSPQYKSPLPLLPRTATLALKTSREGRELGRGSHGSVVEER